MKRNEMLPVSATSAEVVEIIERATPPPPPQPNPLVLAHALLRGRYRLAVIAALVGAALGALGGYFLLPPQYRSTGVIKVNAVVRNLLERDEKPKPMFESFVDQQAQYLKNQRVIDLAVQDEKWRRFGRGMTDGAIAEFTRNLEVARTRSSELIGISFTDRDPAAAKAAVDAVIAGYMKLYAGIESEAAARHLNELVDRRNKLDARIGILRETIAEQARDFSRDPDRLERRYAFVDDELNRQEQKLWEAQVAVALAEATVRASTQPGDVTETEELRLLIDPEMARLRSDKRRIERDMLVLSNRFGPVHPEMERARVRLQDIEQEMADRARFLNRYGELINPVHAGLDPAKNLQQLRAQEQFTRAHYLRLEKEVIELGRKKLTIAEYRASLAAEQPRLSELEELIRVQELDQQNSGARIEIVSEANRPLAPHKDRRPALAVVGGIGMAMLGVGCVMLLGVADRRLRGIADAHAQLHRGSKVLGVVPELEEQTLDFGSATITAHCVHQIRALLQLRAGNRDHSTLAITSPSPGDGKTTLTIALGMSFAASGARTLLIDLDLIGGGLTARINRPLHRKLGQILLRDGRITEDQLREALGAARRSGQPVGEVLAASGAVSSDELSEALMAQMSTSIGISEIISGDAVDDCVTATGVPNLSILPLGTAGREQVAQLSPELVRRMLAEAQRTFDVILIDTGPILGSLEASMAASAAAGVILAVARGGNKSMARRSVEFLLETGAHLEGVVFNRAEQADIETSSFSSYVSRASQAAAVHRTGRPQLTEPVGVSVEAQARWSTSSKGR